MWHTHKLSFFQNKYCSSIFLSPPKSLKILGTCKIELSRTHTVMSDESKSILESSLECTSVSLHVGAFKKQANYLFWEIKWVGVLTCELEFKESKAFLSPCSSTEINNSSSIMFFLYCHSLYSKTYSIIIIWRFYPFMTTSIKSNITPITWFAKY